ncbi:UDP-glycosyltransferase 88F4 [Vitis vinifera]|uniref:UDP-glycosyltransferase 88F4 n=1 Tax=Vitis vinifera TaxID=29760 RepID=A0A438IE64_VITVI|nr:UDP-glycosyltransferase 88F4 [Vitis vinifera]
MEDAIVLYPAPGIGHVVSMIELGKLILRRYSHRFSITILLAPDPFDTPATTSYIDHISQTNPSIFSTAFPISRFTPLLPLAVTSLSCLSSSVSVPLMSSIPSSNSPELPPFGHSSSTTFALQLFLWVVALEFPLTTSSPPVLLLLLPSSTFRQFTNRLRAAIRASRTCPLPLYTFLALKTIREGTCVPNGPTPSVYCIGPLIADTGEDESNSSGNKTRHGCLSWLDTQPSQSVVFLCFGSKGTFSPAQMKEIANGLERSGKRFLWVVKNPPSTDKSKRIAVTADVDLNVLMPEGFLERTKDRGMVVKSWAPQVAVLNHPSVGGFVTHCGWNSVLEAVVAGVPMVAWPLYAEQHLNKAALVEVMKMAIGVEQMDEDMFVSGAEVERRVRELMEYEEGGS